MASITHMVTARGNLFMSSAPFSTWAIQHPTPAEFIGIAPLVCNRHVTRAKRAEV
jgi:hypothetical protein